MDAAATFPARTSGGASTPPGGRGGRRRAGAYLQAAARHHGRQAEARRAAEAWTAAACGWREAAGLAEAVDEAPRGPGWTALQHRAVAAAAEATRLTRVAVEAGAAAGDRS